MSHPLSEMLSSTMDKIRQLVDANTVVGTPITTPDGLTMIPISKVSFGYAGGGSDFITKNTGSREAPFGGGGGGGVTITPVGFLIVRGESVRLLPVTGQAMTSLDRALELLPDLVEKVSQLLKDRKKEEGEA